MWYISYTRKQRSQYRWLCFDRITAIHCSPLPNVSGLSVSTSNTRMGTEVVFSCDEGQKLQGSQQSVCLPSGNWSTEVPYCQGMPWLKYVVVDNLRINLIDVSFFFLKYRESSRPPNTSKTTEHNVTLGFHAKRGWAWSLWAVLWCLSFRL